VRDNQTTGKTECIGTIGQYCIDQLDDEGCNRFVEKLNTQKDFNNDVFTTYAQVAKPICDYRQTRLCLEMTNNKTLSGLKTPDNTTQEGGFSDSWQCKEMNEQNFIVKKVGQNFDDWKCLATGEYCILYC
jgi:hypothetical protein